jgi:undecaprenyl-diphosphatase
VPIVHAIVLGLTQGLSEFLPISSSGHLILVPWLFSWTELTRHPDLNKTFDVALHLGTLIAILVYFARDLYVLVRAGMRSLARRRIEATEERLAWLLLLSALPGALVGAALESVIEDHLGQPWLIGTMLIVFGLVLLYADRLGGKRDVDDFGLKDAVIMGAAQAAALQPGVSRAGATITAGRWIGFDRDAAARISFLMSVPITAGAVLYKGVKLAAHGGVPSAYTGAFVWGTIVSAITGFFAVWFLLRLIRTHSFTPFVIYRVGAGVTVLAIAASGWR